MKLEYKQRDDGFSYEVFAKEGDEKIKQNPSIFSYDTNQIIQPTTLIKILVTYMLFLSIAFSTIKE